MEREIPAEKTKMRKETTFASPNAEVNLTTPSHKPT